MSFRIKNKGNGKMLFYCLFAYILNRKKIAQSLDIHAQYNLSKKNVRKTHRHKKKLVLIINGGISININTF